MKSIIVLAAAVIAFGVQAQTKFGQPPAPAGANPQAFKPLPERNDIVSWKLLAQVEIVKSKDRYVPQFSDGVAALNAKEVKVQGFMMPLEMGDKQKHFILAAMPQDCAFCMPGGPEQMVEVRTRQPVTYGMEAIVLTGKLSVLKDDPTGVFYRLTDAVLTR
jgi:hypothetical protein